MVEVQRLWRIAAPGQSPIIMSLSAPDGDIPHVSLEGAGADGFTAATFDIDVARALAQTLLEACEVAAALRQPAMSGR